MSIIVNMIVYSLIVGIGVFLVVKSREFVYERFGRIGVANFDTALSIIAFTCALALFGILPEIVKL